MLREPLLGVVLTWCGSIATLSMCNPKALQLFVEASARQDLVFGKFVSTFSVFFKLFYLKSGLDQLLYLCIYFSKQIKLVAGERNSNML